MLSLVGTKHCCSALAELSSRWLLLRDLIIIIPHPSDQTTTQLSPVLSSSHRIFRGFNLQLLFIFKRWYLDGRVFVLDSSWSSGVFKGLQWSANVLNDIVIVSHKWLLWDGLTEWITNDWFWWWWFSSCFKQLKRY